ncbi:DNA-binding transcriptional LysR family regulator [Paucibacter oligotrophus]|uniref:DNA-binding transcriptional LysR family regulator n=1 Tax=Roseateles oligotrophus TaxID=1769250 RepID=A0A840LD02_9BURK|nr:LysR family transcriptional regulator [Roseateles oligotrophus]MBB4845601.1 DNA-binding transcriptional LysR family regulator [Roseateles oligotrophus]
MDKLNAMRVFVAVAEAQSFASAARLLGLSASQVTRAVAALEEELGVRLLHRTTRQLRLSEVGARYLSDCRRLLGDLQEAEAQASGAHLLPQGHLTVTAPVLFGRLHMAPVLLEFLQAQPQLTAQALLVDRVVHLLEEGVDLALRISHLPDSSLCALRVGEVRRVIVAAPDYLARHGEPACPADLGRHQALGVAHNGGPPAPWLLAAQASRPDRLVQGPQPRMPLSFSGVEPCIQAAIAGHGLARALSYQVAEAVERGQLRVVLAAYEPLPLPVSLVHPEGRRACAKVRSFVDFAAQRLQARLARARLDATA